MSNSLFSQEFFKFFSPPIAHAPTHTCLNRRKALQGFSFKEYFLLIGLEQDMRSWARSANIDSKLSSCNKFV